MENREGKGKTGRKWEMTKERMEKERIWMERKERGEGKDLNINENCGN